MDNTKSNLFLEKEPLGKLMARFCIPTIISLLVATLYNIVDQIFIANADYLGSYGNAANSVVFPLTLVALGIAMLLGDGCCTIASMAQARDVRGGARHDHRADRCCCRICRICFQNEVFPPGHGFNEDKV